MDYRMFIVGSSCAGKTTLGAKLAQDMNLKQIDLDDLHWLPNWQEETRENMRQKVIDSIQDVDNWVMTGSYSWTWDISMPKTTHIVFIDLPLPTLVWRLLKRTARRCIKKEKCCGENVEQWQNFFSKDSLLLWQVQNYKHKKEKWQTLLKKPPHSDVKFIHLKSPRDVQNIAGML